MADMKSGDAFLLCVHCSLLKIDNSNILPTQSLLFKVQNSNSQIMKRYIRKTERVLTEVCSHSKTTMFLFIAFVLKKKINQWLMVGIDFREKSEYNIK